MKKLIFIGLISLAYNSTFASELKVDDLIKIGDFMKQSKWYRGSEILSLTKTSNYPSYRINLKANNKCLTSIITELDSKTLYVVPSSVEEIPCK